MDNFVGDGFDNSDTVSHLHFFFFFFFKNKKELERVQKVAVRLITNSNMPYEEKLKELQLETLQERREKLSLRFSNKCVKNARTKLMFQENIKKHNMSLRRKEKYSIPLARTVRFKKSAIPSMARHMNKEHEENLKMLQS